MKKLDLIKKQWDEVTKARTFEVPVIDKRTNKSDYVVFDIFIAGKSFIAQHVGLTAKQERSKKIACTKVVIDPDFSLDGNLQELYSACLDAIMDSDFYELTED